MEKHDSRKPVEKAAEDCTIPSLVRDLLSGWLHFPPTHTQVSTHLSQEAVQSVHVSAMYKPHFISGVSTLAQVAPQTCELIKTRPEINDCKFMNVNYVPCPPKCQESVPIQERYGYKH